jgi:hypothetical protein
MFEPVDGGADFLARRVIVAGKLLAGEAYACEVDGIAEVEHVRQGELDRVDEAAHPGPQGLSCDGVVAFSDGSIRSQLR